MRESRRRNSRRGNHRRESRVAKMPQMWGSILASKSGREENADASMNSASRQYKNAKIRVKGLYGRGVRSSSAIYRGREEGKGDCFGGGVVMVKVMVEVQMVVENSRGDGDVSYCRCNRHRKDYRNNRERLPE